MGITKGGCRDLRKQMNDPKVAAAFGKLISGKDNYVPVIEKKHEPLICKKCSFQLCGDEKFCPECGTKVEKKIMADP